MKIRRVATLRSLVRQLSKSHFSPALDAPVIAPNGSSHSAPFASYSRPPGLVSSILPALSNVLETPSVASGEWCRTQTLGRNVPHGISKELALQITQLLHQSSCQGLRGIPAAADLGGPQMVLKFLPKYQHGSSSTSRAFSSSAASSPSPPEGRPDEQDVFQEDEDRHFGSFSELPNVPWPALALGAAGLIPFIALSPPIDAYLPEALFYGMHAQAQAAYGAVILTFLGAPHWGLAMADYAVPSDHKLSNLTANSLRYLWSVVPSLLGWLALLLPPIPQFALLISSFGLVIGVDVAFSRMRLVPSWYLTLRVPLTVIAILSLTSNLVMAVAGTFNL